MAIDYDKLDKIEVYSQIELDAVPEDFRGQIIVSSKEAITISKRYKQKVIITGSTYAIVKNDAFVDAIGKIGTPETIYEPKRTTTDYGMSRAGDPNDKYYFPYIKLCDNAKLEMSGCAAELSYVTVKAQDKATAVAMGRAYVIAKDESFVSGFGTATIEQHDNAKIWAYENCVLIPNGNGKATVLEPDTVKVCQPEGQINSYQYWLENVQKSCSKPVVILSNIT